MVGEHWFIEMFGGLRARRSAHVIEHFRTRKAAALLARLALYPDRSHSREELADLLWPNLDEKSGRNNLRYSLSLLRHMLEPPDLETGPALLVDNATIRLAPGATKTDVSLFETAWKKQDYETAIQFYGGELLVHLSEEWILPERYRLEQLYGQALGAQVRRWEEAGEAQKALGHALRLVALNPLEETGHLAVMRLYGQLGQSELARRQYREMQRVLKKELNVLPSRTAADLLAWIEKEAATVVPLSFTPSLSEAVVRLPVFLTRFFGREMESARLVGWFVGGQTRLVTLTGTGGTGKTRLAVEVAQQVAEQFPGGVWFVPLGVLTKSYLILDAIASTLELPRSIHLPLLEQIARRLGPARTLLVLDNFEHLAAEGAPHVAALLERVPGSTCLVTSRHHLNLEGEQAFPLAPLPVPEIEEKPQVPEACLLADLLSFPSAALFMDRACLQRPDLELTARNAPIVARLCAHLEGIPLAIELAAAWSSTLTPQQILSRLDHRFAFLVKDSQDGSDRHRSLWAALESSYELLSPELQRFFVCLSVFRDGWTLEAAETICEEPAALGFLKRLTERSLIVAEEVGETIRYRLLETLREFGDSQLIPEQRAALQARHARHFAAWLSACWQAFSNPTVPHQVARQTDAMEVEFGNLNAFLEHDCRSKRALVTPEAARALYHFCLSRCHIREGQSWMNAYLQNALLSDETRGAIYYNLGNLAMLVGDYTGARSHYEVCLQLYRRTAEKERLATLLGNLGWLATERGAYAEAEMLLEEGLALSEAYDIAPGKAWNYQCLYAMALERGQYDLAETYLLQRLVVDPDYQQSIGPEKSKPAYRAGAWALLEHLRGESTHAAELYRECLALYLEADYKIETSRLAHFAALMATTQPRRAARWFGAAATIASETGVVLQLPGIRRLIETGQTACRASLGEAAYQAAFAEGAALDWKEALVEALHE